MEEKLNIKVKGMFCTGCETRIKNALLSLNGILDVTASYNNGEVKVSYDKNLISPKDIEDKINVYIVGFTDEDKITNLDYEIVKENEPKENNITILCVLVILIALYIIFNHFGWLKVFNIFPTIESTMSYGMIFVVGILTSVHCIAMCGGINLSQSIVSNGNGTKITVSNLAYNLGRVISYTIVGGIVRSYRFSYQFKWYI